MKGKSRGIISTFFAKTGDIIFKNKHNLYWHNFRNIRALLVAYSATFVRTSYQNLVAKGSFDCCTYSYDFVHIDSKVRGTVHGLGKGKENSRYFVIKRTLTRMFCSITVKTNLHFHKVLF